MAKGRQRHMHSGEQRQSHKFELIYYDEVTTHFPRLLPLTGYRGLLIFFCYSNKNRVIYRDISDLGMHFNRSALYLSLIHPLVRAWNVSEDVYHALSFSRRISEEFAVSIFLTGFSCKV